MSLEYFISRRVLKSEVQGKKVSKPIVRISVISIALAVVVNLITIAVVTGFQREVKDKVSGFGSHITIQSMGSQSLYENEPILKDQSFFPSLQNESGIASINCFAYKPVLFQSDKLNGANGSHRQIHSALIKGVDSSYDFSFFREHLVEGRLPRFESNKTSDELLISTLVAKNLQLKVGNEVRAFFVRNQPVKKWFKIVGIYETGLEEFDSKLVIGDLRLTQELNDWGLKSHIEIEDTLYMGQLIVKAKVSGGSGNYRFDMGRGYEQYSGFTVCPRKDTIIRIVTADISPSISGNEQAQSIPDTSYLKIQVKGNPSSCVLNRDKEGKLIRYEVNDLGNKFTLKGPNLSFTCESLEGKGSSFNYVGGFEVNVENWDDLNMITDKLRRQFALIPTKHNENLMVSSIRDTQNDIFVWLGFLDINVVIILTLMILIGIINMGSGLLVLILVRTNFIGILKAMGMTNWSIRKIFLYQAGWLILRGILYGNIIGLTLCGLQYFFGIVELNPEVYYLKKVPIDLQLMAWLALNVGTLIVCLSALIIPSVVITRIVPARSIKFN